MLDLPHQLLSSLSLRQMMNSSCIYMVQVIGSDLVTPYLLEGLLGVHDSLCLSLGLGVGGWGVGQSPNLIHQGIVGLRILVGLLWLDYLNPNSSKSPSSMASCRRKLASNHHGSQLCGYTLSMMKMRYLHRLPSLHVVRMATDVRGPLRSTTCYDLTIILIGNLIS